MQQSLLTHLDVWTSALETRSTAGRGSNSKINLYGIKKLRELILELAVQGKLVLQDPNDEPASVLLDKIAAEKAQLIKAGKLKKQEPLPPITDDEKRYAIPESWSWYRVGDYIEVKRGASPRPKGDPKYFSAQRTEYHWVKISDINLYGDNNYLTDTQEFLTQEGAKKSVLASRDTLIMTNSATIGIPIIMGIDGYIHDGFLCFPDFPKNYIDQKFFLLSLKTLTSYLVSEARGLAQLNMNTGIMKHAPLILPPFAEQQRIVAKVDELMALCDALEQEQTATIAAHQTLVEQLLAALTQDDGWQRIAMHFDTLFTTENSIDQLKQTILQLAVMGKLVPQNPNDEPASVLLDKIATEKAQLIKAGKLKKEKPLLPITDDEKPFELPNGWEWVRLGLIINIRAELVNPEDFQNFYQIAPDIIEKNTGKLISYRTVKESGIRGPNSKFYKGQLIYSKIRPSLSKVIIAKVDGLCSADMYPIDSFIQPNYLLNTMLSEVFLEQVRSAENRIKMPKLNIDSLSVMKIPLPPLAEQQRIVAKVDELMALCDALKAEIRAAQTTQLHLADALTESF